MSRISIGKAGSREISLDLDTLLRTRLLVQANSGGGKSYALRRILEQAFGKVQSIVIDPAGEFATLREKYGYVLVGEHGETPADIRSAGLVAEKLLELRASAVCDLYGLKPPDRHVWLKKFLTAVMNAPKRLWHPVLFVVDEAHKFAPEKGEGESEAKNEMLQLASDGRKYGFCAIFATQRLAKLDKSAAAELLNVLIGPTFMDIDLERAHRALGIVRADWREFDAQMKTIEPGHFWALGRAISTERVLVKIGGIETTHPEAGSAKHAAEPPPPPEKVKALLPKLADLPKAAEEKARSEAALRQEIRELKAKLRTVPTTEREVRVIDQAAIDRAVGKAQALYEKQMMKLLDGLIRIADLANALATKETIIPDVFNATRAAAPRPVATHIAPFQPVSPRSEPAGDLTAPQQRILDTISMLDQRRISANRESVARWMGLHPNGGRYGHNLAALREAGRLDGFRLTGTGRSMARPMETGADAVIDALKEEAQRKVMREILAAHPRELSREELAEKLNLHPNGGRYGHTLAWLRDMGVIPERGAIVATEGVFQ